MKMKAYNILALMRFKPLTSIKKYFSAYEISKTKAYEISKEKAYNILALIDQIQSQKYFPIKINTKKVLVLMGFKPMTSITKYFQINEISKEKFRTLWPNLMGLNLQPTTQNIFLLMKESI